MKKYTRKRGLYPLYGKPTKYKNFGLDVETTSDAEGHKNQLITSGCIIGIIKGIEYFYNFSTKEELCKIIASHNCFRSSRIWVTNLLFDFNAIFKSETIYFNPIDKGGKFVCAFGYIYDKDNTKLYSIGQRHKLVSEGINKKLFHKITFVDTLNFMSGSVKNMGHSLGIEKLEMPKWLLERKSSTEDEYNQELEYNKRDALITCTYMDKLQETINNMGATVKLTCSSTAVDLFRRKYMCRRWIQPPEDMTEMQRKCLRGGFTLCKKRGLITTPLNYYDFNSSYCSVMRDNFLPDPNYGYFYNKVKESQIMEYEGFAKIKINIPKEAGYVLPVTRGNKLRVHHGVIEDYFVFPEIRYALSRGCKILKISDGQIFFKKEKFFTAPMQDIWNFRKQYEKGSPQNQCAKTLGNGFFGKYSTNLKKYSKVVHVDELTNKDFDSCPMPLNDDKLNKMFVVKNVNTLNPNYVFPIISAYVTAYGRIKLFEELNKDPDFIYCDTDSIITPNKHNESNELGELKKECNIKRFLGVKSKFYGYETVEGKFIYKIKGIKNPEDLNTFDDYLNKLITSSKEGKMVMSQEKFVKYREGLRRGLLVNDIIKYKKVLLLEDDKLEWGNLMFDPLRMDSGEVIHLLE